jgi:uncharacterized protein involved in exopolysaccharide biosynthesis
MEPQATTPSQPPVGDPQPEDISLSDLWGMLVEGRMTIILVTVVTTLVAISYALLATPVYRAELIMVPAEREQGGSALSSLAGQFGGAAGLLGINIGGDSRQATQTALAILESRQFVRQFIIDENLMPALFADRWDEEKLEWKRSGFLARRKSAVRGLVNSDTESLSADGAPSIWAAYRLIKGGILGIEHDQSSGLITLTIEWHEPQLAADWANSVVDHVNDVIRRQDIEEAEKSIVFLKKQLAETLPYDIEQAFYGLLKEQTKVMMLADSRSGYAFKVIDPAVKPETRIRPARTMIVALGFFLGLIIGALVAVGGKGAGNRI